MFLRVGCLVFCIVGSLHNVYMIPPIYPLDRSGLVLVLVTGGLVREWMVEWNGGRGMGMGRGWNGPMSVRLRNSQMSVIRDQGFRCCVV